MDTKTKIHSIWRCEKCEVDFRISFKMEYYSLEIDQALKSAVACKNLLGLSLGSDAEIWVCEDQVKFS